MASFTEEVRKKSLESAAKADEAHIDAILGEPKIKTIAEVIEDTEEEEEDEIQEVQAKPVRVGAQTKIKKKNLPKYDASKDKEGKSPMTVYLRDSLVEQLEEHRWQGRWKSTTKLLEHIIEEYYKKL